MRSPDPDAIDPPSTAIPVDSGVRPTYSCRGMDAEVLELLRRSSGLGLDRECRWHVLGDPVTHARTVLVLNRGLEVLDGGEVIVRVGGQWAYVTVAETPYCVRNVALVGGVGGRGAPVALELSLSDDTREVLAPATLSLLGEADLRCRVKGGAPARFLRPAWHNLLPLLDVSDEPGVAATLRLGGVGHAIRRATARAL